MTQEQLNDPFKEFKAAQREGWGLFAPLENLTLLAAPAIVKHSKLSSKDKVLDVGCGTGVVAITAAKTGAQVSGLDLSPQLIERARYNSDLAKLKVDFIEGDVENLPYPDRNFDVVVSQFGHMFAPRPKVAIQEMLRVLKPGGTIAFSTWPPDLFVGKLFQLVSQLSPPVEGVSPPSKWGNPDFVREQFGNQVKNLVFDQSVVFFPALSLVHYRESIEKTLGPVIRLIQSAGIHSEKLIRFRSEVEELAFQYYSENSIRQDFLMTRATKI